MTYNEKLDKIESILQGLPEEEIKRVHDLFCGWIKCQWPEIDISRIAERMIEDEITFYVDGIDKILWED